ncbi:homeobox-leucine zipper protein HAT22-like protein [Tanacetum coccineum]
MIMTIKNKKGQKQELAKKLHLPPRQIEVWFQNRRARTKLKQIKQECALLQKCYETLIEENQRLKKELREARCSSMLDLNVIEKGFEKGYLLREGAANKLPRSNQKKQSSHECKEMLRRKLNEIEAYNASKGRAAVKEKGEGSVNITKEKRALFYICRK